MVVEKLLQLLVAKVNAQLFKSIVVKDLKASNVQYTNESNPKIRW